ncbi:MAG: hypothetical protein HKN11_20915, partial [Rhizobiales bacterium]|nr:hypothetical protein [Hyphomicrobiales bacterium]
MPGKPGGNIYQGTSGDDLFVLASADLKNATFIGGLGFDTLQMSNTGKLVFNHKSYKEMSGIDSLDFSGHAGGTLTIKLRGSMVAQTDAGLLTIVAGSAGIDSLQAAETGLGTIQIAGTGTVALADGADNVVTIADGSTVTVTGGSGNDTITASSTGSTLDGGAGSDQLMAGSGADDIIFTAGYGSDQIGSFDVALDTVSLSGITATSFADLLALIGDDATGAILDLGNGDQLQLTGVAKSSLTTANFLVDGQSLPDQPAGPETIYIDVGTTAAELNAIIAGAGAGSLIILRDGTHVFDQTITISRDDISLMGESEAGTILQFSFAAGSEGHGIAVTAGAKSYIANATDAIAAGATSITMAAGHGITAGDMLYIQQDNTQEYLDAGGWTNVSWEDADNRPFREMIVEVDYVDGNTIYLKHQIAYDMDLGLAEVYSIDMLTGIALSEFTVTYDLGTPNSYDFANSLPAYEGLAAVYLKGTTGASLSGISILDTASHGFDIRSSIDLTADDLYVSGAHNKGGGGNGYGI